MSPHNCNEILSPSKDDDDESERVSTIEGDRKCGGSSAATQPETVGCVNHGNRGRSVAGAVTPPQKQLILTLAQGKYRGFNDSHVTEKLCVEDGPRLAARSCAVSCGRRSCLLRRSAARVRRLPCPRFGMMALTDARGHDWLHGRGPELTPVGFQDDATDQSPGRSLPTRSRRFAGLSSRFGHHDPYPRHSPQPLLRPPRHLSAQRCPLDSGRTIRRKQSPTQLGRALDQLGTSRSPPFLPRPKAASNAPGPPCTTLGQRTLSRAGRYLGQATPCSAPLASLCCRAASTWLAVWLCTITAWSTRSHCRLGCTLDHVATSAPIRGSIAVTPC
jgi:hypothetical protein